MEFHELSMDTLESKSFDRLFTEDGSNSSFSKDHNTVTDPRTLKAIYMTEEWVFIMVDRIAMKLSQIPWQVHKESTIGGEYVCEPWLSHPFQRILDNPNPLQSSYSFKYSCIVDYCVTGNALIYSSRPKSWLVHVPSEIIALDIDGRGNLLGYDVVGSDPLSFPVGQRTKIDPMSMIHVRRPNPSSVYWGLSPLVPGQNAILFNRYSSEYLLNFYKKGAQPGMILEMTEESNAEQAKKLLMTLETSYTGRLNQRRGMVLPKGVKAQNFSPSLADQQLITYIQNNRETLIALYGVPPHELGIASAGSLGSEEYKTALRNFWQGPLTSIAMMFESEMTARLQDRLGRGYVIKLNMDKVPALQEDLMNKAMIAEKMLAVLTPNEIRARVWNEKPILGGEALKVNGPMGFGGPPAFGALSAPMPQIETTQMAEEIKPLSMQDAPNYRDSNVEALQVYSKSEDGKWLDNLQKRQEQMARNGIIAVSKLFLGMLENQITMAARIIKNVLVDNKSVEMPNAEELRKRIKKAFDATKDDWERGYVDALLPQVDIGYGFVLDVPFNKPYEDAITALKARNKAGRREVLAERGITTFENMSKSTTESIMKAVEFGVSSSQTIQEIAKSIRDISDASASRALTIARTETLTASSIGQAAATKDASTVIPNLVKVWVAAFDDRTRDSHKEGSGVNGEVREVGEAFSNGLLYPRDTNGAPEETINCRCSFLTVSKDDLPSLNLKQ